MAVTSERITVSTEAPRREIELRDVVDIWYRRRFMIVSIIVLTLLGMEFVNWVVYPTFDSKVKILIDSQVGYEVPFSRDKLVFKKSEITQTQSELLVSQPNLAEVVTTLKMDERPKYGSGMRDSLHRLKDDAIQLLRDTKERIKKFVIVDLFKGEYRGPRMPTDFQMAVGHLQGKSVIKVEPVSNTDVVVISVRDRDPFWAANIANTLAEVFAENELEARRSKARSIYESIASRIEIVGPEMTGSRRAIADFKDINDVVNLDGQIDAALTELSMLEMEYWDLSQKEAVRELTTWEAKQRDATGNRDIKSRERIALMERLSELAELQTTYQPDHPKVVAAQAAVDGIRAQLAENLPGTDPSVVLAEPDTDTDSLKDALITKLQSVRENLSRLSRLDTRFQELTWDHERVGETFKWLERKREDASIAEHTTQTQIRIIEGAQPMFRPIRPRKWMNRGLALLTSVALAVGLGVLLEYMDRTIRTPEAVSRLIGLKTLGSIPYSAR